MNIDLAIIAQWAGAITAIYAVVKLVVQPFTSSIKNSEKAMKEHTDSIIKLNHTLVLINRDIDDSKEDRLLIHRKLEKHDERLDNHSEHIIEHKERIDTLFKRGHKYG